MDRQRHQPACQHPHAGDPPDVPDGKDGVAGSIPAGAPPPNQQLRSGATVGLSHAEGCAPTAAVAKVPAVCRRSCTRRPSTPAAGALGVDPEIEAVRALEDPLKQTQRASELLTRYQAAVTQLSRVHREAIEQLIAQGMTKAQLAERLGMTRARVGQLLAAGPRSEGLFLGNGKLPKHPPAP
jgi:DNA-binding CsgD family transcriptional regulator